MRLEAHGVAKTFVGSRTVTALEGIDLDVGDGEFVCVVGPSGCGKSTLLYMLAGLEFPTAGEIVASGKTVTGTDSSRALMFQDGALFPWLSVLANVEFGLRMKNLARDVCEARARGRLTHTDAKKRTLLTHCTNPSPKTRHYSPHTHTSKECFWSF